MADKQGESPRTNFGRNSETGQLLERYVERIEGIRAQKKELGAAEAAELAQAKSDGFVPSAIRFALKKRAMKPHDRQESEMLEDVYLNALGMAEDTPLFRAVGLMAVDTSSREDVIESMKKVVPETGSITVEVKGQAVKLFRDPKTGEVTVHDVVDKPVTVAPAPLTPAGREPPPPVDGAGAEALGAESFKANEPIIKNPFPFGDIRRSRWDKGWREASGGDGMGPQEPAAPPKPDKPAKPGKPGGDD